MGEQEAVVNFIRGCAWPDLSAQVQAKLKSCFLDCLGAMLAGTQAKAALIADQYSSESWSGSGSTIVVSSRKTSPIGAAFANAVAANATDIDDCGIYTGGHPGAQVFPTALALAEAAHSPGHELLTAMLIGYEVAFRGGRCMMHRNLSAEERGFRACGSWGSVATAAVASRLTGLSRSQTVHALGIAEYNAPDLPLMRDIDHPAMVKHGIGLGAMTGIMSARLAELGFTGVPSILFFDEYAEWVRDIGQEYLITRGMMWKRFSCCAWTHPALYAVRKAIASAEMRTKTVGGGLRPDSVKRIVVTAYHEACRLGSRLPQSTEEAQFNLAWPIACLILHGEVAPKHVLEPALTDLRKRMIAQKVEIHESEDYTRLYDLSEAGDPAGREVADVLIELKDGSVLDSGCVEGEVYNDWSREEVEAKFRWLTEDILTEPCIDRLIRMARELDSSKDVRALTEEIEAGRRDRPPKSSPA